MWEQVFHGSKVAWRFARGSRDDSNLSRVVASPVGTYHFIVNIIRWWRKTGEILWPLLNSLTL